MHLVTLLVALVAVTSVAASLRARAVVVPYAVAGLETSPAIVSVTGHTPRVQGAQRLSSDDGPMIGPCSPVPWKLRYRLTCMPEQFNQKRTFLAVLE